MGKTAVRSNPVVAQIFEELERFQEFCQDYGYRYNEADLRNFKSYAWQQYSKYTQGKNAKDMWLEDARRFSGFRSV
jgi:hypothetical protein